MLRTHRIEAVIPMPECIYSNEKQIIMCGKVATLLPMTRNCRRSRYPYRTSQQSCRRAERIPGLRFYRLPRRSKERPADRAREANRMCALLVHDNSSLARKDKLHCLCLVPGNPRFVDHEYDITADCYAGAGRRHRRDRTAERLNPQQTGKSLPSEDIVKAAAETTIRKEQMPSATWAAFRRKAL